MGSRARVDAPTRPQPKHGALGEVLTERLRALGPGLSPGQRRVADLAVSDPAGVAALTIKEVAAAADTSVATVQRLCRALELSGYSQFRMRLAAAAGQEIGHADGRFVTSTIAADAGVDEIIESIAYADARAVEHTAHSLSADAVSAAVRVLAEARRVDVYGVGSSAIVAVDLHQKLHQIGRISFAWQDQHMALASAALLTGEDVALGISHTGTTRDTIEALAEARRGGATTIALTNFVRSPIVEVADIVLTTAVRETTFRSDDMASRLAQLTVVDILYVALAQFTAQDARRSLDRVKEAMKVRQVSPRRSRPASSGARGR